MIRGIDKKRKKKTKLVLLSGLGNRFATPDALGPFVLENLTMNRHILKQFKSLDDTENMAICGIAPGVMSQTGMETSEILKGIIEKVEPDVLLVIDSLASRSIDRLCKTIQITNTGISPGAGIGNNRNQINCDTMGIPVIAIGVPTVVDAGTIVYEALEKTLSKNGYSESEIYSFFQSITDDTIKNLFVTPKDIDEEIRQVGSIIARGLSDFIQ
jgi:spore protease